MASEASDGGTRSDAAPRDSSFSLQDIDIAIVGAILLPLFVFLKAYGAAEFSLTTAAALLSTAPLSVVLGTLISYAYLILPLVSLASLAWLIAQRSSTSNTSPFWVGVAAVVAVVTGALSPWPYLWPWMALLALPVAISWLGRRWSHLPSLGTLIAYYFLFALLLIFISTMTWVWTPVEVVVVRDAGEHSRFVAHVVNSEDGWTTLLTADSRRIVRVRTEDVEHRQTCKFATQRSGRRPLFYVFLAKEYTSPNHFCRTYCRQPDLSIPSVPADGSTLKPCQW
jgi:hypothetical protein